MGCRLRARILRYSSAAPWAIGFKNLFEKNFTIDVTDMSDTKAPGFFSKLKAGLAKTRAQLADGVGDLLLGEKEINDSVLEDLETALITADVGVDTTEAIIGNLTRRAQRRELANTRALHEALHGQLVERLLPITKIFELVALGVIAVSKVVPDDDKTSVAVVPVVFCAKFVVPLIT